MHIIYKHLKKYGLLNENKIENRLRKLSNDKISTFFEEYNEVANRLAYVKIASFHTTDIYPDSRIDALPINLIRQLSIYSTRIYLHDPLLDLLELWNSLDVHPHLMIRFSNRQDRHNWFIRELADAIKKLIELKPIVETDIIQIIPSQLGLPQKDPTAIYVDDLFGPKQDVLGERPRLDVFPAQLRDYSERNIVVKTAKIEDGKEVFLPDEPSTTGNIIYVGFPEENPNKYYLFDIVPGEKPNGGEEADFRFFFSTKQSPTIDTATYQNWVDHKKFEYVDGIIKRMRNDLYLASLANARFLTTSRISRDLATLNIEINDNSAQAKVISALLKFNLPFFDKADFNSIVKARKNEAAFFEFTLALEKTFKEIEGIKISSKFQDNVNEIYNDILIAPLLNIDRQFKILRRNLFYTSMVTVGTMGLNIVTQGNTLILSASVLAGVKILEMYKDLKSEEDKIQQLPSFFYWEVINK